MTISSLLKRRVRKAAADDLDAGVKEIVLIPAMR